MTATRPHRVLRSLGFALLALSLGCTAEDNQATSVAPTGPGGTGGATIEGTVVACELPVAGVTVSAYNAAGNVVRTAQTTADGRWRMANLGVGTFRLGFDPPAPDPNDPNTELRETFLLGVTSVDGAVTPVRPMFLVPVEPGGLIVTDKSGVVQTRSFRVDPFDLGSAVVPGLEDADLTFRPNVNITMDGQDLISLGIDADTGTPGRQLLVEVAVLNGYELPAPILDADGDILSSQAFYSFYPHRFELSRVVQVDLPNNGGLEPGLNTDGRVLSFVTGETVSAGTVRVDGLGLQNLQIGGTGPEEFGIFTPAAPPTPRTDVVGQIRTGGVPVARAGIAVVTNGGLHAFTDATGAYRIDGVPIPLQGFELEVIAITDSGLAFDLGRGIASPQYPTTTIDVELEIDELGGPVCDLASSEPAQGATGVRTNDALRLRFDSPMDEASLASAITLRTTAAGVTTTVPVTVAVDEIPGVGSETLSDVYVFPDADLPINASVTLRVGTKALDVAGNALTAPCTLSFQTGTSTLALPQVYFLTPTSGTVESTVTIRGRNLDTSAIFFDGTAVTPDVVTDDLLEFEVPLSEGSEGPGPRNVQIDPGAVVEVFTIVPRIDAVQIDSDPDPGIETLVDAGIGTNGTAVAGVDQNDGTLITILGQNLFDPVVMANPVVTFGRGDGDLATTDDGDAEIDGTDETADPQRIDVNVPPNAVPGDLRVTVDFGGAAPAVSPPRRFSSQITDDDVDPTVDAGTLDPMPGATGVPSTQTIRVLTDEPVSADSTLLVGTGIPLRLIAGTTLVTTTLDGEQGVLEFFPEGGALPVSSTLFVQTPTSQVRDVHANAIVDFSFTFDTGATAPGGGTSGGGTSGGGPVAPPLGRGGGTPLDGGVTGTDPRASGQELAGAFASARAALELAPSAERPAGPAAGDSMGASPSTAAASPSVAETAVDVLWLDGELVLRVAFPPDRPVPGRDALRFRLASADGADDRLGLVADLDRDGRFELSLAPTDGRWDPRLLLRADLVAVADGILLVRVPGPADPAPVLLRLDVLEVSSGDVARSPVVRLQKDD